MIAIASLLCLPFALSRTQQSDFTVFESICQLFTTLDGCFTLPFAERQAEKM